MTTHTYNNHEVTECLNINKFPKECQVSIFLDDNRSILKEIPLLNSNSIINDIKQGKEIKLEKLSNNKNNCFDYQYKDSSEVYLHNKQTSPNKSQSKILADKYGKALHTQDKTCRGIEKLAAYVITLDGRLVIAKTDTNLPLSYFHSALLKDKPGICCGTIKIKNGKITYIDNFTSSYIIDQANLYHAIHNNLELFSRGAIIKTYVLPQKVRETINFHLKEIYYLTQEQNLLLAKHYEHINHIKHLAKEIKKLNFISKFNKNDSQILEKYIKKLHLELTEYNYNVLNYKTVSNKIDNLVNYKEQTLKSLYSSAYYTRETIDKFIKKFQEIEENGKTKIQQYFDNQVQSHDLHLWLLERYHFLPERFIDTNNLKPCIEKTIKKFFKINTNLKIEQCNTSNNLIITFSNKNDAQKFKDKILHHNHCCTSIKEFNVKSPFLYEKLVEHRNFSLDKYNLPKIHISNIECKNNKYCIHIPKKQISNFLSVVLKIPTNNINLQSLFNQQSNTSIKSKGISFVESYNNQQNSSPPQEMHR